MTLLQLRYLCSVVHAQFSMSRAARDIGTSQPGISQQIRMLERELGVELLGRQGNRIAGLTPAGRAIHEVAQRMLGDADTIRRVAEEHARPDGGRLIVATTHIQARYMLRDVIRAFKARHPAVQLTLRQATPGQIAQWVASGEVDIGIAGKPPGATPEVVFLPLGPVDRCLIALRGHPLLRSRKPLTLEQIAEHPLITLDASLVGGWSVLEAFQKVGLQPNVVLTAVDVDVIKTYAEVGLGVAIVPQVAYEPARDRKLAIRGVNDLFPATVTQVQVRRGSYLRGYTVDFIGLVETRWDRAALEEALAGMTLEH